jgi:hypothetical protein
MRLIALASLLPLAIAAPAAPAAIPELSASQWNSIQSTFVDGVRSLGSWSWTAAEEILAEVDDVKHQMMDGGDAQQTIWQQLKADPHSFSKLVKLIEVSKVAAHVCDTRSALCGRMGRLLRWIGVQLTSL